VPEILISGDHGKVDAWRLEQSLERTRERRPDLYKAWLKNNPPAPKKRGKRKASPDGPEESPV
jgi:tRNA (guanine37-N1)-methyltransferase